MAIGMQRREFITLPSGAAATWPVSVRAQQPTMALVGLLAGQQLDDRRSDAVRQGLKEAGYIEGCNLAISIARPMVLRPITGVGHRNGGRSGGRHPYVQPSGCSRSQSCNRDHSGRIRDRRRSGRTRSGSQRERRVRVQSSSLTWIRFNTARAACNWNHVLMICRTVSFVSARCANTVSIRDAVVAAMQQRQLRRKHARQRISRIEADLD